MRIQFSGSSKPTVGVKVELQIIDPKTKNVVSGAPMPLRRAADVDYVGHRAHPIDRLIESLKPVSSRLESDLERLRVRVLMTTGPSYGFNAGST